MERERNTGYQSSFYPLSSDEFLMRKNEMLPTREESILSLTCSLFSACRAVTALFSFHLPITSRLLLVGCQWVGVTSHRSSTVQWTQPLGHDTVSQCWQLYHTAEMVYSRLFCAFLHLWEFTDTYGAAAALLCACVLVSAVLFMWKMREEEWANERCIWTVF